MTSIGQAYGSGQARGNGFKVEQDGLTEYKAYLITATQTVLTTATNVLLLNVLESPSNDPTNVLVPATGVLTPRRPGTYTINWNFSGTYLVGLPSKDAVVVITITDGVIVRTFRGPFFLRTAAATPPADSCGSVTAYLGAADAITVSIANVGDRDIVIDFNAQAAATRELTYNACLWITQIPDTRN